MNVIGNWWTGETVNGPWLGVGIMTGLVVIGLVLSVVVTKNAGQRRASILAFISLALIVLAFYLVVIENSMQIFTPFFSFACILVPLIVYLATASIGKASSKKVVIDKRQPTHGKAARPSVRRAEKVIEPVADVAEPTVQEEALQPDVEEFIPVSEPEPIAEPEPVVVVFEPEPEPEPEPVVVFEPESIVEPEPEPEPVVIFEPEPEPEPEPVVVFEPEPESEPELVVEVIPEPEPEPEPEPVVAFVPEPEPEPEPEPIKTTYDAVHEKAEKFKAKGLHAVAARMYEECAVASTNPIEKKKSLLDAMASYVKAGKPDEAKQIALVLSEVEGLSKGERLKIDAVLRMN